MIVDLLICVVMVPCASSRQMTKRYELDFRERAKRMGCKVQTSVKNFQAVFSFQKIS